MRAHSQRRRLRTLGATWVGFVALLASIAAGAAQASPPMKLAERRCGSDGGTTFVAEPNRYSCRGMDNSKTFSFMDSANRHCVNGFKGVEFDRFADPATGEWSYTCILSF